MYVLYKTGQSSFTYIVIPYDLDPGRTAGLEFSKGRRSRRSVDLHIDVVSRIRERFGERRKVERIEGDELPAV
jgi:hypothetical protein